MALHEDKLYWELLGRRGTGFMQVPITAPDNMLIIYGKLPVFPHHPSPDVDVKLSDWSHFVFFLQPFKLAPTVSVCVKKDGKVIQTCGDAFVQSVTREGFCFSASALIFQRGLYLSWLAIGATCDTGFSA